MVTQCICHNIPFFLILEIAKQKGYLSLDEIKQEEKICDKCELCNKYVEETLKTGETRFKA